MADLAELASQIYGPAPAPDGWAGGFPPPVPRLLQQLRGRRATTDAWGPGPAPAPAAQRAPSDVIYAGGPKQPFDSE